MHPISPALLVENTEVTPGLIQSDTDVCYQLC
jgi:hypothetical protein